jgi:DNA repair exonuclease SbcCD ATPase subunit
LEKAKAEGMAAIEEIEDANKRLAATLDEVNQTTQETVVSEQDLNDIFDSVSNTINDALTGTSAYTASLEHLREELNLTEDQAQFLAEAQEVLIDTMAQMGPETEEAAAFFQEFQTELKAALEEMRSQGTDGLDDLIDTIHDAQEAVGDFGTYFEEALSQDLVDSIDNTHESFEDFLHAIEEAVEEINVMNFEEFIAASERIVDEFEYILDGAQSAQEAVGDFGEYLDEVMNLADQEVLGPLAEDIKQVKEETDQTNSSLQQLIKGLSSLPGPVGKYTRQLMSNVQAAQGVITSSGGMLTAVAGFGSILTAVLGPIAALTGMLYKAKRELEALDRTAKKALAMGDSVAEVQALSFALGEIAGMDPRQTEMSLRRLQRSIGAASEAGGRTAKVYKDLGLDLDDLKNKTPTQQFNDVAEAVSKYGTASDKARISQQLFGRGSQNIVLALTAQNEVLKEAQEFAKEYGLTVDDIQAETLQMANDAWGRVSEAMGGWMTQLSAELAPLLTMIARTILDWIPPVTEFKWVIDFIVDVSYVLIGVYQDLAKVVAGIGKIMMGDWREGMDLIKEGFEATSAVDMMVEAENVRREAEKTAASRKEQAKVEQAITEEMKKQAALDQSAQQFVDNLQKKLAFMEQEEFGIRSKKIFELQSEGADEELIQAALEFEQKIADIERARKQAQDERVQAQKDAAKAEADHLAKVERGRRLDFEHLSKQDQLLQSSMEQAMELADLFSEGLIRPETFEEGIAKLDAGLNQITEQANQFWIAMNGPQMSEFGRGREGLELDLIRERGGAISRLRQGEGMEAGLANRVGIGQAYGEARNNAPRPVEVKLVSVLDMLEQHLRLGRDPNKIPVGIAQPGDVG